MFRKLLLFLALLGLGSQVKATHMSGGEIYWECIGPNQFLVRLVVYRDCAGIAVDPSYQLTLTSPCGNRNLTVNTPGGVEISQLCDLELPNSTCNGGALPGIEQYIYSGTITLPPCDSWSISWTNIYRNNAIVNLTNPGNRAMYIESVLNSEDAPCNDSPVFTNTAIPYVCLGYPVSYSYGAVDSEADSMSYSLIGARMANGALVPYGTGFSSQVPITGLTLDPVTGLINFTLNDQGNWVVVVLVTEYDANGNVIGTIMRDMQFVAYPCSNIPPDAATGLATNVTGAAVQTGPRSVEVCETGDFCFDMVISDADMTNVLEAFSNIGLSLPGATFNFTGTNPITAQVCWTASPGTSGFYPFIVNVNDGACPIPAFQTYVYSITVLPGLLADLDVVDEACLGSGNGTITATVMSGTGPYTYDWTTGADTPSITAAPGTYGVTISDVNGCISDMLNATIGTAAQPNQADAGPDVVGCVGEFPVQITGSVTNATSGSWSGGAGTYAGSGLNLQYTPTAAEITAGSVTLTLTTTGNTGCPPATDAVTIDLPNSFAAGVVNTVDATCFEIANGSALYTPDQPGFTYAWSDPDGQTTPMATGLAAGSYTVTVMDSYGCSAMFTGDVGPADPLAIASITSTPEACLGSGDGSATVIMEGGTTPYEYLWSTSATTASITAGSGTYSVSVTDANGCAAATGSITIIAQGLPNQADAGPGLVGCMGELPVQLDGSVTNATSGTWSGGTGSFIGTGLDPQYQPSAADVAAGFVELTLTTTGNTTCPPATDVVTIALPNSFANAAISAEDATCFGGSDGSTTFTPNDPAFSYLWNDASAQTTATATDLPAGNYTVVVTDAFGCDTSLTAPVGPIAPVTIASLTATQEPCLGSGNGTATVTATGGTQPYTYLWSTGADTPSITATSGTYSISITDANGCAPATGSVTIDPQGLPNAADAGPDVVGCLGGLPVQLNGSITNATGCTWTGGSGAILGSGAVVDYMPTPAEVLAGGVTLTLTTTGNTTCPPASDAVYIALSNSFLNAAVTTTDPGCNGSINGSIAFTPVLAGLTYQWDDAAAQTTPTATGLSAGTYMVLVTDALGCDTTMSATLDQPAPLAVATVATTNAICYGGATGTAILTITGGTPAYEVAWNTGQTAASIGGLSAGTYNASVTDAQGCTTQAQAIITQPQAIVLTAQAPDTVCVNVPVELTAQAAGGTGTISYNWHGLGSADTITAFFTASQTVTVSVTDAAGCTGPTIDLPVTVLDLNAATLTTYGDTTVCIGGSTTVGAQLIGYPGSYTISWTELGTTGNGPFNLPITGDQDLHVAVTDQCGNTLNATVPLRLDVPPTVSLPPIIAEGCAPLTVQMPDLNLGNVSFHWDLGNGSTSAQVAPILEYGAGSYTITLTVTTPLGCSSTSTTPGMVIAHTPPTAAFTASTWSTDFDNAFIQFTDQSTGGIATYAWTFGDGGTSAMANPSHNFMEVGTFDVELWVEDVNGCTASVTHPVEITPVYDVTIPNAFTPGSGGGTGGSYVTGDLSNDVFYPFVRFVDEFQMRVFNRWGELIFESNDIKVGWDGYYRGQLSPQDVYMVQTWFHFVDGKEVQKLTDLTLFR